MRSATFGADHSTCCRVSLTVIYTQTTDVEVEVNGLMTYDRAVVKMDEKAVTAANTAVYKPLRSSNEGSK